MQNKFMCIGGCEKHIAECPSHQNGLSRFPMAIDHRHTETSIKVAAGRAGRKINKPQGPYRNLICNPCNEGDVRTADRAKANNQRSSNPLSMAYIEQYHTRSPTSFQDIECTDPRLDHLFNWVNNRPI